MAFVSVVELNLKLSLSGPSLLPDWGFCLFGCLLRGCSDKIERLNHEAEPVLRFPARFSLNMMTSMIAGVTKRISYWLVTLLAVITMFTVIACQSGNDRIVVGSKNFTEQVILGEIIAQQIERRTNLKVDRKFNLGGTLVCHQGLISGSLDIYPEYTGTALTAVLKQPIQKNPQQVFQLVQQQYAQQFQADWTKPFGFNNSFAMIIRGEDARRLKLETLSQASQHTPNWTAGFGPEFQSRPDGLPGLAKTYNLKFTKPPKTMDLGLLYKALKDKQVDVVAGNATDGLIQSLDLTVLKDDRQYFPPYEAAPIVRQAALKKHPELKVALDELGQKISETKMRELNYRIDGKKEDLKQVVADFLAA
jgi:osmoprotectant transport system substrate-binding protein